MAVEQLDPTPAYLQAGGVVALAFLVWWEQRDIKRSMREIRDALVALVTREAGHRRHKTSTPLGIPVSRDED